MNSEAAHAMKFNLEKTFHRITDGFFSTDENESAETSENEISITIDSMDDIDDAIAFMPDLPVPEYIPEGFELEELKVSKFVNGNHIIEYTFNNKNNESFFILSRSIDEEEASAAVMVNSEVIELDDRVIYYYNDTYTEESGASFMSSSQLVDISGDITKKDMIDIASKVKTKN